ncbi:MAG: protein-L-isoaspartate O-methyltransferase [Gammaproteobacteria bacterium]|nr:protein-L-isoaspartate O-methyltransferase [Gammaproteobacteria bacterium]MDD9823582.1 protein-L-isoaspartate O-methyltransferase [Gammaproteobacteria bacterium]MDD9863743.1 protein-L-isoaspartate O-methyltransferase [Gammaproteobacteria bacterium]
MYEISANSGSLEQARRNLIESQVRAWEVFDPQVLELLNRVHREDFMPAAYRRLALADFAVPLGHGQYAMTPKLEARLLQCLAPQPGDKALEIGTGSAYLSALLASCSRELRSLDLFPEFLHAARDKLGRYGIANVTLEERDGLAGCAEGAPYDIIAVTGAMYRMRPELPLQLAPGGRLFAVLGRPPAMQATLIRRLAAKVWRTEPLFETEVPFLVGAEEPGEFRF